MKFLKKLSILLIVIMSTFYFSCDGLLEEGGGTNSGSGSGSGTQGGGGSSSGGNTQGDDDDSDVDTAFVQDNGTHGTSSNGLAANTYFVRPASGGSITLTPDVESDIWYLFTNTSDSAVDRPNWTVPSSNIVNASIGFSEESKYKIRGLVQPILWDDTPPHPYVLPKDDGDDSILYSVNYRSDDDVAGAVKTFYDDTRGNPEFQATCKLVRTVETANGPRTLVIYEENNMTSSSGNLPTDIQYKRIANAFLKDGADNDIYDKLTSIFGSDKGTLYNDSANIPFDGKITLLYCNIKNQGDPSTGRTITGGYYTTANLRKNYPFGHTNKRSMVTLHAHSSGGDSIGKGLTTLAHEFQHLIHAQHFDSLQEQEAQAVVNETFSSVAETLVADFLAGTFDQEVSGPFYVGAQKNRTGYIQSIDDYFDGDFDRACQENRRFKELYDKYGKITMTSSEMQELKSLQNKYNENNQRAVDRVNKATMQGRGPYYLKAMGSVNYIQPWGASGGSQEQYGLVASFGAYLLINYGADVIKEYCKTTHGVDLDGIVSAINTVYPGLNLTKAQLITNWGTAAMLSNIVNLKTPYAFNRRGWYDVNGLNIPSINMYNYYPDSSAELMDRASYGPQTYVSSSSKLQPNTNAPFKVKANVPAGTTFTATAPTLSNGLTLTVIAVPKKEYTPSN